MVMTRLDCFKAYDIRGRLGETLDEPIADADRRSLRPCAEGAAACVVGHDARASSPLLKAAAIAACARRGST
jgi:phosphomannomutase